LIGYGLFDLSKLLKNVFLKEIKRTVKTKIKILMPFSGFWGLG
jgi:hypothetical protein